MIRFTLDDRYINSEVVFEESNGTARMSFIGTPKVPIGTKYLVNGLPWKVTQVKKSVYNPQVVNVDLVLVP